MYVKVSHFLICIPLRQAGRLDECVHNDCGLVRVLFISISVFAIGSINRN